MISPEIQNALKVACKELIIAENELYRPHEDVVTLSACQVVRNSMKQIMHIYLSAHKVDTKADAGLNELLELCKNVNQAFLTVDMSNIECKGLDHSHCDGKYCLSIENVSCCIAAGNQLKKLVCEEFSVEI